MSTARATAKSLMQRLREQDALIGRGHLQRSAHGLDLLDADDRATFRTRLDESYARTRLFYIRQQAKALGYSSDGDRRSRVVRHIADHFISANVRETRWLHLCEHYGANPADTCIGGLVYSDRVERFCGVATEFHGEHENGSALGTFPTFEEACDALGSFVLDGYAPEAVYDLDTGERIDVHVASPVITRSEDQMGANPLLPEELDERDPSDELEA